MAPSQIVLWDDFINSSFSATDDAANWDIITDTGATVTLSNSEVGGAVVLLNATTATDECLIRNNGAPFQIVTGKKIMCGARFKLTDADDQGVRIGLMTPDTADPIGTAPTNGIYFSVVLAGADGSLDLTVEPGATDTDTGKDLTDATYVTAWFVAYGADKVQAFVDLEDGNGPSLCANVTSGLPANGTALQLVVAAEGSVATDTTTVDWIFVVQER
jgi:hypothetical protein